MGNRGGAASVAASRGFFRGVWQSSRRSAGAYGSVFDPSRRDLQHPVAATGSWQGERLIDRLAEELLSRSDPDVALRGDRRWIPEMVPLRSEIPGGRRPGGRRPGGVYLIVGGLERLGLAIAEELADRGAKLVLTGRTAARKKHAAAVERLEKLGAEVLVVPADIADQVAMERVIRRAEERFGELNGVVHAAGARGDDAFVSLARTTPAIIERHFRPKVAGVAVLERVLRGKRLDFCLLCSSLSSILGGVGFAAYAATNRFLDAFARRQSRLGAVPWIRVDWEGWRAPGARPSEPAARREGFELAGLALTAAEGRRVVARILATMPGPRVAVSSADLGRRIERQGGGRRAAPAATGRRRSAAPGADFVAPAGDLERAIARVWGKC